jgi:hypothetical protein
MKSGNCGGGTEKGKLLCSTTSVKNSSAFSKVHTCQSFMQKEGETKGICEFATICAPMKKALQGKPLIDTQLGHVICPHPSVNISYLRYQKFDKESLRHNYKEYLE